MKKNFWSAIFFLEFSFCFCQVQNIFSAQSRIDWTSEKFYSAITLDIEKAGIRMPSGKNSALNKIDSEIPVLIKDPLFSLYIDSEYQLADIVMQEIVTLEQISAIITNGKRTPGFFQDATNILKAEHTLNINEIGSLLVKHKVPYQNPRPIEQVPSRKYSGIVIDARGDLPVHGEFHEDIANPCFFPKVWDSQMNLIYERNMVDAKKVIEEGQVFYHWSDNENDYKFRIGGDPLHITARAIFGRFRTDPIISREDALKILVVPENLKLLREGKIVILLDKDRLVYDVTVPEKNETYYVAYRTIKQRLYETEGDPTILDTHSGIQILYDLKFEADKAILLASETTKIKNLAQVLKEINSDGAFTILVEGHTADVQKPIGQMQLSIERTQAVIQALVAEGIDREIFSYRGYGGTQPIAPNDTAEGRAQNRRVIITARPKATYIQRQ